MFLFVIKLTYVYPTLEFMNEMLKWIKTNGLLIFSVPVGEDAIIFNLHRVYGYHYWYYNFNHAIILIIGCMIGIIDYHY